MERLVIEEVERVLRHECAALGPDSVPLPGAPSLYLTLDRIAKLVDDLAWLCGHDHDLRIHHGYRLNGPPGGRTWWGPDGSAIAEERPPPQPELFGDPDAA